MVIPFGNSPCPLVLASLTISYYSSTSFSMVFLFSSIVVKCLIAKVYLSLEASNLPFLDIMKPFDTFPVLNKLTK